MIDEEKYYLNCRDQFSVGYVSIVARRPGFWEDGARIRYAMFEFELYRLQCKEMMSIMINYEPTKNINKHVFIQYILKA